MFCPNCGNDMRDGAKFCDKCGNTLPDLAPKVTKQNTFCPFCGSDIRDGAKFCDKCGQKIEMPTQQAPSQPEPVVAQPVVEPKPVYEQPVYQAPTQPVYAQPTCQAPNYAPNVYAQPLAPQTKPLNILALIAGALILINVILVFVFQHPLDDMNYIGEIGVFQWMWSFELTYVFLGAAFVLLAFNNVPKFISAILITIYSLITTIAVVGDFIEYPRLTFYSSIYLFELMFAIAITVLAWIFAFVKKNPGKKNPLYFIPLGLGSILEVLFFVNYLYYFPFVYQVPELPIFWIIFDFIMLAAIVLFCLSQFLGTSKKSAKPVPQPVYSQQQLFY